MWLVRLGAGTIIVTAALVVLGVAFYIPLARTAARVPGLTREVARLTQDNERVVQLAHAVDRAEQRYADLRAMLGANVVPAMRAPDSVIASAPGIYARAPGDSTRYPAGSTEPRFWPLDDRGFLTRGYQSRAGGHEEPHAGLDVAVPAGTPVRAAGGGLVESVGTDPDYGLFVLIAHADGYESMYGHASRLLVRRHQSVSAGQVIALSGNTGRSTAPHLHFEIRRDGTPIDPTKMVQEGH